MIYTKRQTHTYLYVCKLSIDCGVAQKKSIDCGLVAYLRCVFVPSNNLHTLFFFLLAYLVKVV